MASVVREGPVWPVFVGSTRLLSRSRPGFQIKLNQILVIRSRRLVQRALTLKLTRRNFSVLVTRSNLATLSLLNNATATDHAGHPIVSLIILSLVLPNVGKLSLYHLLHRRNVSIPVLVLDTGNARASHIINLRVKTSSCLAGPFNVHRLITHYHTLLQQRRTGARPRPSGILAFRSVALRPRRYQIFLQNRRIGLSPGRFHVLRLFVKRPQHI